MILVADSGSTKTDWLLSNPNGEPIAFKSAGLNPYFLTEKEIAKIIQEQLPDMIAYAPNITEIYFFGAGCSSADRHEIVSNALSVFFGKSYISIDSDLLASAYATCGHEKGFCCVLGTGSNISFFDGEEIHDGQHGLGYVLGDEGSGTWFGKALITDYLYGRMPADINERFKDAYHLDKETVIKNVYQKQRANSYLASFSKFLSDIRHTSYGQDLLQNALQEFVDTNIKCYSNYDKYKCHFVGSIASVFKDELKAICGINNVQVGKIMKQPINDLLEFIINRQEA
ncbi:N-acetylglucosamine kinase [Mucilaginibacter pallidiroseus]|uniref:N-acetylglucosamine kinase n=1 Tax=Mucilaginibacter pallidiroseus TaxID=2599295 RepID=A0A563UGH0_9SPHI|nr:N-acetylglucosamine kinase [Mucilaginibacter pallidiroseus]TWR30441.1 N-acetylglucosamine kinase [Mucilaginibacter pallidiroseus]